MKRKHFGLIFDQNKVKTLYEVSSKFREYWKCLRPDSNHNETAL